MKILYCYWTEYSVKDMIETLQNMGHSVHVIDIPHTDYNNDSVFAAQMDKEISNGKYDLVFTFDFFPIISAAAERGNIPYVSWIYDMPHSTLSSPEIKNPCNNVFLFDYDFYKELEEKKHPCKLHHMPLAVNTARLDAMLGVYTGQTEYKYDVSFVGSLYEKCLYNQINYLPEYIKGYLEGVIAATQQIYGANMVKELLKDDIIVELKKYVKLDIPEGYDMEYKDVFANLLNAKVTSEDRIRLLSYAAKLFKLSLWTGSEKDLIPDANYMGKVDYYSEMPKVFRQSKINLNITLRSIKSGIPLRALDIMGAGGFLLSAYQPELAELFTDGEDCVLFTSDEDMLIKIEYYLNHDEERSQIALNGYNKVKEYFSYEKLTGEILTKVL